MRTFRMYDLDRVEVEWTVMGLRWRLPSRGALISSMGLGALLANVVSVWVGLVVWLVLSALVIYINWHINRMDPLGALKEATQAGLLWRTLRNPVTTNGGAFTVDAEPLVTNTRRRI